MTTDPYPLPVDTMDRVVWAVATDDDSWVITADGRVVETLRAHYDAREALQLAEQHAGRSLLWRLDDADGFVSA